MQPHQSANSKSWICTARHQFTSLQFCWNSCYVCHWNAGISPFPLFVNSHQNPKGRNSWTQMRQNRRNGAKQVISQGSVLPGLQITTFLGLTISRPKWQISSTANTEKNLVSIQAEISEVFRKDFLLAPKAVEWWTFYTVNMTRQN